MHCLLMLRVCDGRNLLQNLKADHRMQIYSARRSPASLILYAVKEPNVFKEERGFVSDCAMRTVKWAVPLKVSRALVLRSTPDRA